MSPPVHGYFPFPNPRLTYDLETWSRRFFSLFLSCSLLSQPSHNLWFPFLLPCKCVIKAVIALAKAKQARQINSRLWQQGREARIQYELNTVEIKSWSNFRSCSGGCLKSPVFTNRLYGKKRANFHLSS